MSSANKPSPQAKVDTNGPKFPRFILAMSAASRTGTLHHLASSANDNSSLSLDSTPPGKFVQEPKGLWPKMVFGVLCVGVVLLAVVVVGPRIVASIENYGGLSSVPSQENREVLPTDGQVYELPLAPNIAPEEHEGAGPLDSFIEQKPLSLGADQNLIIDDQHRPVTLWLDMGELTSHPIEVTFAHAADAVSGPSAALDTTSQVQARVDEKAFASRELLSTTTSQAVGHNSFQRGQADYRIQLAAMSAKATAERMWEELLARYGEILGSKGPVIERSGKVHLLQVGPFHTAAEAEVTCAELKRRGAECLLVQLHGS